MRVSTLPERVETVVVGAGQAGLSLSAFLRDDRREHLVLERRAELGGGWQDRWDAFRLVTPNWTSAFPGWEFDGPDPDAFMPRDDIAGRVRRYAEVIDAPVATGTEVTAVRPASGDELEVETNRGTLRARNVVSATGSFHVPRVPDAARSLSPRVHQLHSHAYRNEGELPPGGVLVVGSGQTGVQLTEELRDAGRDVVLAVGSAGRVPRRYRGRDCFRWLHALAREGPRFGTGLPTVDELPDPRLKFAANPHVSGHKGGHDTNLRQMALDGVRLAGHLSGIEGERVTFAPDLAASLERADRFFDERFRPRIEAYIAAAGLDVPPDDRVSVEHEPDGIDAIDLLDAGISTVIWTGGYGLDYGWIDAPIFGERGYPEQRRGVTSVPGLYFVGLLWQHTQGSATLFGVSLDARFIADRIAERSAGRRAPVPVI